MDSHLNVKQDNSTEKIITLYHGSKSGIHGAIAPISRNRCDFGKGFYMGTEYTQPLTLICNYPNAKLYTLEADLTNLKIFNVEIVLNWALLIAYNRGKLELIKDSDLYKYFKSLSAKYDMIVGYIANDRVFVVLDRFFNREITDLALVNILSALDLEKQYVALTKKACDQIKIIDEKEFSKEYWDKLKIKSEQNRSKGISMANEICRKYRREGRFFDEILEEWK